MGRKKHVLIWVFVTIILMVVEFFVYKMYEAENIDSSMVSCDCEKTEIVDVKEEKENTDNCTQELKEMDQALFTGIGMIFVSRYGDVYYEPKAYSDLETAYHGDNLEQIAQNAFGHALKYQIDSKQIFNMELDENKKHEIVGYKLDLHNIKSVFYTGYGNSSANYVFAFISYNGEVSILKFENEELSLPKKLAEYSKIVSVVKSTNESGTGLMFIDKCGNKYYYAP